MRVIRFARVGLGLAICLAVASVQAEGPAQSADAGVANKPSKKKKPKTPPPPSAAGTAKQAPVATQAPAITDKKSPPPSAAGTAKQAPVPVGPTCSIEEPEQPRGGRLEVRGKDFGEAPVVRIAERPARMIERRSDRISVQVPPDSNGGAVTLQSAGHSTPCGNLTIIGKNR
ncbi:MAG TPA: hypothetical protein VHZ95_13220 [Polyangiales bacterium]|nr:hypothetical protein [Polyangiales bacterium]